MGGAATAEGTAAGGVMGGDPGSSLGGARLAPRGMPANKPAHDSGQPTSTAGSRALRQPHFDHSVQAKLTGPLQKETSRADMQNSLKSDRDTKDDLVLQSPHAMPLRQQQGGQAAELLLVRSSSSSGTCSGGEQADPSVGAGRQPDDYCTVDPAGSSLGSQQHHDKASAEQCQHRSVEGQLDIGTRAGHLPRRPDTIMARGQLFLSPKRGISSREEDKPITCMSDSQSEGELEINVLSPSPAKRCANQTL